MTVDINSPEFSWANIIVTAMGRTFERIMAIEYDVEAEKKQIYGRGKKVKGIQRQNEKPSGSITLGQSEVEALIKEAQKTNPFAKITDITFDVQVHYLRADAVALVKDRILGVEITKAPKSMKQNDGDMEVKLDFIAMDILYNVI